MEVPQQVSSSANTGRPYSNPRLAIRLVRVVLLTGLMTGLFPAVAIPLVSAPEAKGQGFELPPQKLLIALPIVSYTRATFSRSDSGSLPFGFAAEYRKTDQP